MITAAVPTMASTKSGIVVSKIAMGNVKEEIAHTISNAISSLDHASSSNQATWYKITTEQNGNTKITDVIPVTR